MSPIMDGATALTSTIVPARRFGLRPGTGADTTAAWAAAFSGSYAAAPNCTLVVEPGTYLINDNIHLSQNINLWAYGVTLDLGTNAPSATFSPGVPENYNGGYLSIAAREAGTLTNKAAFTWGTSGGQRPAKNWIRGLTVSRTPAAATAAARLYAGILMLAPYECELIDCSVDNFREGLVMLGGTAQGCAYDIVQNFKSTDCRYGITLYCNRTTGAGWANQNIVRDGRLFVSSTVRADPSWNEAQWEPLRILWESGGSGPAAPNNNVFENVTMEGAYGRKVRCEGTGNGFMFNRYETVHSAGTADITIGEASRANSNFCRNLFIGGDDLATILDYDNLEFLNSGTAANNGNTFYAGTANWFAARSDTVRANHRFTTSSSTAPVVAFGDGLDREVIRVHHIYSTLSAQGTLEFQDTGETARNAIGMETASPYDLSTLAGLKVAGVFRVRLDGTIDAILANPQSGGMILIPVASGLIKAWASSSGNDVFAIADSNRDVRLVLKAQETVGGSTYLDALNFYDDDATPTLMNTLGLHPSTNLGGQRPLLLKYGIDVNEQNADADTRIRGDTITDLFYVDASTDRVGVGTATPLELVHVNGVSRMDGDHYYVGSGSGLPYASCYGNEIGWSQATAVQDTWYEISDADITSGELNLATHSSGSITVTKAGRYLITYTVSAEVSAPNKHVQTAISISGTEQSAGISHYNSATASEQFNLSGTAVLSLAASATVQVSIRTTDTGTPDLAVDHINISVVQVGG